MKPLIKEAEALAKSTVWGLDKRQTRTAAFGPYKLEIEQVLIYPTNSLQALRIIRETRLEAVAAMSERFHLEPWGPAPADWVHTERGAYAGMAIVRVTAKVIKTS